MAFTVKFTLAYENVGKQNPLVLNPGKEIIFLIYGEATGRQAGIITHIHPPDSSSIKMAN